MELQNDSLTLNGVFIETFIKAAKVDAETHFIMTRYRELVETLQQMTTEQHLTK